MIQETLKQQSKLGILTAMYEKFQSAGDTGNADKLKQLIMKVNNEEFIIAFCGHFSAGKSSMINFFLGDQVLPSSPIPTSANTVKVQKGEDYAKVFYHHQPPVLFPAPYDFKEVKKFAKDGDSVSAITISSNDFSLPDSCAIMDTPGIDSTDDAHRVSTESALHLADVVFYVMDYNHVQSEVNFLFTKELLEAEKPTYLIINMIDKHDENELSFQDFKLSVTEAFANWNVYPDGIFYTSVRDLNNSENEIEVVKQFIYEMAGKGLNDGKDAIMQSANALVERHLNWLKEQYEEEHADDFEVLSELPHEERVHLTNQVDSLLKEKKSLTGRIEDIKVQYADALETILKGAYIMPAATRDLGKSFLESAQPDFKMGLLFAKKKTDAEREARIKAFLNDLQEKVKTQLEWHLKELAVKMLNQAEIHDSTLEGKAQALQIEVTESYIKNSLRPQVDITGEYVLNYTNDLASAIKKKARDVSEGFLNDMVAVMEGVVEQQSISIDKELEGYSEFAEALKVTAAMNAEIVYQTERLEAIANQTESLVDERDIDMLLTQWNEEEKNITVKIMKTDKGSNSSSVKEQIESDHDKENKEAVPSVTVSSADAADLRGKEKLMETAASLQQAAKLIQPLRGFQSLYKELKEKANRLEQQTFTVALFGAFSAGKSSFANALMGESVLPVSPNPTTAAINKIMSSDAEHPHGTATVKLKTEAMLLEDVSLALAAFDKSAKTLDEALQLAGQIIAKAGEVDKGKTHLSFLRAFHQGLPEYQNDLGNVVTVDLEGFKRFAAEESKSCLVDLIELRYDCEMTKQGMVLVDTPGADSINARHTGAAFEYIKNSDAILFVTYYNHPFSRADREFLIQLGRVKDSFAMDKMFFIVNAVDLAQTTDELDEVMDYVTDQLNGFGIRFPKLFPLTSKGALMEKQTPGSFKHSFLPNSGISEFQGQFDSFIENDLTGLAIESAQAAVKRTEELLRDVITASRQDEKAKRNALEALSQEAQAISELLSVIKGDAERQRLKKEVDELTFYSKQRVFFRFNDFFKESFNPAVLKDDGGDLKIVLKQSMKNLLDALGFDLAQEMRATALRTEMFVNKLLNEKQSSLLQQMQKVRRTLSLQPYEPNERESIEFTGAFAQLDTGEFKKELALFKNPKSFFEKNEKAKMSEGLQKRLDEPALIYVKEQGERIFEMYNEVLDQELLAIQKEFKTEISDIFAGLRAALEETVDLPYYENAVAELAKMHSK
ncbi:MULTISPECIES: dynamin family protein [Peribacillus]|uniref:dynamin family protein n=1 Tax=Peribacillus TaxID=2675229 RepID=UPI001F4E6487|nr:MULTISPECIES: dynamin family protein [unclassified Peribacillus]MCK1982504.1 dynamin family protein [Peribacillus sp. Aquil_B1]MCK2008013.1 dynamin family protein [Peribacillus sp. Aquil_B8]